MSGLTLSFDFANFSLRPGGLGAGSGKTAFGFLGLGAGSNLNEPQVRRWLLYPPSVPLIPSQRVVSS